MNFPDRARPFAKKQLHLRADAVRIARRADQTNSQTRFSCDVPEQFCRRAILGNDKISPAIMIKIGDRRPPLLAINFDAGVLTRHRLQLAGAISQQQ